MDKLLLEVLMGIDVFVLLVAFAIHFFKGKPRHEIKGLVTNSEITRVVLEKPDKELKKRIRKEKFYDYK
jgi:hypothetical protein